MVAFSIPFVVLIAIATLYVIVLMRTVSNGELLIERQRILQSADRYLLETYNVQSLRRGYLLTANDMYREDVEFAIARARKIGAQLHADAAARDDREIIARANGLFEQWLRGYVEPSLRLRARVPVQSVVAARAVARTIHACCGELSDAEMLDELVPQLEDALYDFTKRQGENGMDSVIMSQANTDVARLKAALRAHDSAGAQRELQALDTHLASIVRSLVDQDIELRMTILEPREQEEIRQFRRTIQDFAAAQHDRSLQQQEQMHELAMMTRSVSWILPAAALLLLAWVIWRVLKRVTHSINEVNHAAEGLEHGETEPRVPVTGNDEFALLACNFNRMAAAIERRTLEAFLVVEQGELLQSCHSVKEALHLVRTLGERWFGAGGALYLATASRIDLVFIARWDGEPGNLRNEFSSEECWALRLGRMYFSGEGAKGRCTHLENITAPSTCIPLHAFGELSGLLVLFDHYSETAGDRRSPRSLEFIRAASDQVALAIANLQLRESLRNESIRDPATQLYNRRYMEEVLEREVHRAARHHQPLSVLMFDIDRFKTYNMSNGDSAGDRVMQVLGKMLLEFFRAEDAVFRFSGEEFVALLADLDPEDAAQRAEQLRAAVEQLKIEDEGTALPGITISVGMATFPADATDAASILDHARRALAAAKRRGRNRVIRL